MLNLGLSYPDGYVPCDVSMAHPVFQPGMRFFIADTPPEKIYISPGVHCSKGDSHRAQAGSQTLYTP
jgi:hypothetical protein